LQLLPQPPLPEVSDRCSGTLDCCASKRASPDALCPCGLHATSCVGTAGSAKQKDRLRSFVSRQCGNPSRSRPRFPTSRRGDRLLQCATHLESKTRAPPACPLRGSRRRSVSPSHALDPTTLPRRPAASRRAEDLRRLVKAAVPKRLGGLFQTTLRRPRVCASVSGPL